MKKNWKPLLCLGIFANIAGVGALCQTLPTEGESASSPLRSPSSSLAEMERSYDEVLEWLPRLYEAQSGGFYESLATKNFPKAGPDIQSMQQALGLLQSNRLIDTMPPATRTQMIGYLQSRQEAQSGLFVDSHYPEMRKQERVMGRALQFSVASLRLLGAQPLHALPGTRQESLPDRFSSLDKLRGWLNALDWEQPWQALDAVSSQKTVLKLMPPEQHKPLVEFIYNYVKAKQDPQTGMVGGGEPIVRISGMAKFGWFCQEFDLPLPRADADLGFVMAWYRSQPEVTTLTMVRNPIHHLVDLQPFLSQPMTQDNKALVVRESARLLRGFRQNDGAFSMQKAQFPLRPNDLWPPIGNSSQPQSDLNGTSQARTIREKAYALAGISPDKVPLMNGTKEFWRQWQRRVP